MDLNDFKEAVTEAAALLKGLQKIIPNRVDQKLIDYLEIVQADPIGLEVLRNAIKV